MRKLKYTLAYLIGLLYMIPFYIIINVAFKPSSDLSSYWKPPTKLDFSNFVNAWNEANLMTAFKNNIIITVIVVFLVVIVGSFAAYPLARYETRLNRFVYFLSVSCMIVPPLTILVPLYKLIVNTVGTSNYLSVILPHIAYQLPITIFLFTGFIKTIPRELDEAALIDGCSRFGVFFRILFPLLKPVTATVIILVGVNIWNDYTFSVFFLQKSSMHTITVGLSQFFSQYENHTNWVAAGCIIASLPFTLLYLFMQKYFIKGLSAGAVKG